MKMVTSYFGKISSFALHFLRKTSSLLESILEYDEAPLVNDAAHIVISLAARDQSGAQCPNGGCAEWTDWLFWTC